MAGLRIHDRYFKVTQAQLAASSALMKIWQEYDLTWGEIVAFHGKEIAIAGKYIICTERHPEDPDKKGDEA